MIFAVGWERKVGLVALSLKELGLPSSNVFRILKQRP